MSEKGVTMSKAHRGKGVRALPASGRGTCPICKKTGIKTLYEQEINQKKVNICKQCKAALSHGKMQEQAALI